VVEPRLAGWWHEVCCFRRQMLERRNLLTLNSMAADFRRCKRTAGAMAPPHAFQPVVMLAGTVELHMTGP